MNATSADGSKLTAPFHGDGQLVVSRAPWSTIAEAAPATVAERILMTIVGFPRRSIAPEILAAARRRARWQRAKVLYKVMRGLTGILVRLTLYGLAYRLARALHGGPFRRHQRIVGPSLREPVSYPPAASVPPPPSVSIPAQDDWAVTPPECGVRDIGALGRRRAADSSPQTP